jgi:hypothetical protein
MISGQFFYISILTNNQDPSVPSRSRTAEKKNLSGDVIPPACALVSAGLQDRAVRLSHTLPWSNTSLQGC